MASTIEKKDNNIVEISLQATREEFNEGLKKAYAKNKKKFQVPGFRKGKVPYALVVQYYGEGVLYEDAIEDIVNAAYPEAIKEHGLKPVSRPDLDVEEINEEGMKYKIIVTVKPEFTLGQYEGVEVPYSEREVTDETVNEELERMQKRNSSLEEVTDRAAQEGDTAVIDYEGFKDDVPFDGGKGENYSLKLGSHSFIPGFEEQVIGHNAGEEFEIQVTFPEEYHSEELKGADARFHVKIHTIKAEILPELDDEFAKDVSEFDTLEELKADIREKQEKSAKEDAKNAFENEVVRVVCDNTEIDIPDVMIENELENMVQDQAMRMQQSGIELDMYLQYIGQTMEQFREQMRPMAKVRVKSNLVIEKITEELDPQVTDEEYNEEVEKMAKAYGMQVEEIKSAIGDTSEYIRDSIRARKTVEYLAEKAVKTEPKPVEEPDEEKSESDDAE
ncbi:trigger factor [Ruminococcaceae bacterium YRB3002]|nr:trigger factor [Ruminococcaceae bacterium YRB3002]